MTELYKRFRPKSLDAVVGNGGTVAALQKFLKKGNLPHTILFKGPSGCGKTTLARILAKELGCGVLDLREYNSADFRGIDTIRDISRIMTNAPAAGNCRVFILDEAHQLSKDAQNAALKILEDTPKHVYFFICTTDPQKLIATIRSRCTEMPVDLLKLDEMTGLLERVRVKAKLKLKGEILDDIAAATNGSPRAALVLLDKLSQLPPSARAKALANHEDQPEEVIALCRALFERKDWRAVSGLLRNLKEQEPESIRHAVMGYCATILRSGKKNDQAYWVIKCFEQNFYDSKGSGLVRACYEAVCGE